MEGQYVKVLFGNQDVKDAMGKLEGLLAQESILAATETLVNTHRILESIKEMLSDVRSKKEAFDHILDTIVRTASACEESSREFELKLDVVKLSQAELQRQHAHERVQRWLSPPNPSTNHNAAFKLHHSGTGDWFLHGEEFKEWKGEDATFLWIHGKPGSGKSVLCSAIIEDLKLDRNGQRSPGVVYFYFDFRDQKKRDARGLLSSLATQLSHLSSDAEAHLQDVYSRSREGRDDPSILELGRCVKKMLSKCGNVFVVLDALDECPAHPERTEILEVIEDLVGSRLAGLHLCITSRPEYDIRERIVPLAGVQLNLHEVRQQNRDINIYVRHTFRHDHVFRRWRPEDAKLAIRTLSHGADGMFRWVFCQLDILRKCLPKHIRRTLKDLPKTLDETYQRILQNIDESLSRDALRLLQCLVFSKRPLDIEELADILAIDFDLGPIPQFVETYRPSKAEVLRTCSSLIVIVPDRHSKKETVQFAHFSVQEYLLSERLSATDGVSFYHLDAMPSHIAMVQLCLSMLLHSGGALEEYPFTCHPFAVYAAQYWIAHTQYNDSIAADSTVEMMMEMLLNPRKPFFLAWLDIYDPMVRTVNRRSADRSPLHYAARSGFYKQAEILLRVRRIDANLRHASPDRMTALYLAALEGHPDIVLLLLQNGADAHAQGRHYHSVLQAAAHKGHVEVVKVLLEFDADMGIQSDPSGSALLAATRKGRAEIVSVLLEFGVNANLPGGEYGSALRAGAAEGHLEIVQLLLEFGADVNARHNRHVSALQAALGRGHNKVARVLLEFGADVHSWGGLYGTALQTAVCAGSLEAVLMLLEFGADANARGGYYGSALQAATSRGRHDIVQTLLERGADVNAQGGPYGSALQSAAFDGSLELVRSLIASGADVNTQEGFHGSASEIAMRGNRRDIAQVLAEHGAIQDVDSEDDDSLPMKMWCCSYDAMHG
ncbi:ankyrin repeat-containing domain protein [Amylostereum chailletii]|nr:ankyrin repeat-containing domain protein [Amylostereum chailletii]